VLDFSGDAAFARDCGANVGEDAEWAVARAVSEIRVLAISRGFAPYGAVRRCPAVEVGDEDEGVDDDDDDRKYSVNIDADACGGTLWAHVGTSDGFVEISTDAVDVWAAYAVALLCVMGAIAAVQLYNRDRGDTFLGLNQHSARSVYAFSRGSGLLIPQHPAAAALAVVAASTVLYLSPTISAACAEGSEGNAGSIFAALAVVLAIPLFIFFGAAWFVKQGVMAARNAIMAAVGAGLVVGAALALAGLITDWNAALNPLARVSLIALYYVVIFNTRFIMSPAGTKADPAAQESPAKVVWRLKVTPFELRPEVQRFRYLKYLFSNGIPDELTSREFKDEPGYIYTREGTERIQKASDEHHDVLAFMLSGQKHALVLLLEPLLWGCFFVVTSVLGDTRESWAAPVWSPVLAIGLVSLRLAPDVTRLIVESARASALESAWYGVKGLMVTDKDSPSVYRLQKDKKKRIRFFMDRGE
jgi:hypothetical protein